MKVQSFAHKLNPSTSNVLYLWFRFFASNISLIKLLLSSLGKCKFLKLHCKDLRVAKDWIGNTWVAVNPQPDILSVIQLCLEQRKE